MLGGGDAGGGDAGGESGGGEGGINGGGALGYGAGDEIGQVDSRYGGGPGMYLKMHSLLGPIMILASSPAISKPVGWKPATSAGKTNARRAVEKAFIVLT